MAVVGHDHFGPMHHGSGYEGEGVLAEGEGVPFANDDPSFLKIRAKEVFHHGKRLLRGNHHGFGEGLQEVVDVGGVVGLHVLDYEIIGLSVADHALQGFRQLLSKPAHHSVSNPVQLDFSTPMKNKC